LEENCGALQIELSVDELQKIDEAASRLEIKGARYPESAQKMIDR
jgi:aryl-alcohol dehydrogenase-like predicted oxidoreductase